jgi:hypothetical protein
MIAGFALENRPDRHVIGIDASATLDKTVEQVTRIAGYTAAQIGLDRDLRADEITIVDGSKSTLKTQNVRVVVNVPAVAKQWRNDQAPKEHQWC